MSEKIDYDAIVNRMKRSMVHYSDGTEIMLLGIDSKAKALLGVAWSRPMAKMGDNGASYRFINYLENQGLIKDYRGGEKGWRKFSYVDLIYIELVIALRRLGVKSDTIRYFFDFFSKDYDSEKVDYGANLWLDLLIVIHCGIEMEILITPDDEAPIICDPPLMHIFGTAATNGQIRISLSTIVNALRSRLELDPIVITNNFGDDGLDVAEADAIFKIRNISNAEEEVRIHKTTKGDLLIDTKKMNNSPELRADLSKLAKKYGFDGFTDLALAIRNGDVAYVKETQSDKY